LNIKNEDLERTTRELRLRTEELEKVNKYRSEFLANMSMSSGLRSIQLFSFPKCLHERK